MGEGRIGHWVPINRGRLPPDVTLEVHSVTHWNLMSWKFTDNQVSNWTTQFPKWPHQAYVTLSHSLCRVLRHVGCLDGNLLGCDSGGWYHLEDIAQLLCRGVTEHDIEEQGWRPRWMIHLEVQLRGRNWLAEMTQAKWLCALLRAMAPGNHEPPRYQLIMEQRWNSAQLEFIYPRAAPW